MDHLNKAMKKLKHGDMRAFDVIYEETKRSVFFTILNILNDRDLSDDIMQDAYIAVVNKIDKYEENTNARNWIITIAKNLALNEYNRRKKVLMVDYGENEHMAGASYDKHNIDTPLFDLARKILKEDELNILILIIVENMKRKEVSKMLDIPIGTVTWKYNEAIKKIKVEYERMVA